MCAAAGATAQTKSAVPAPAADTVLLSETADGDYIVRRFIVKSRGDADYSIRYQINLATLNAALNGNPQELDGLNAFVDNLVKDTLRQVCAVTITGYSSPDGPLKFNEALAAKRAGDFKAYVDRKYDFSKKYKVTVNSVAEDWETCRALVAQSSMPDRQSVLNVIDGKQSSDQKELALKKMPAAWSYLKKNVLPKLRRVELTIGYGAGNIVEQRTMIPKPKPCKPPRAMWFITATLRSSLKAWANGSISVKSPLTVGALYRWCRILRAWASRSFLSDRGSRICPRPQRS